MTERGPQRIVHSSSFDKAAGDAHFTRDAKPRLPNLLMVLAPRSPGPHIPVATLNRLDSPAHFSRSSGNSAFKLVILLVVVAPFLALLFAMWQLWDRAVGLDDVLLLVGLYIPISLGVTAGFHRMLTHKSFAVHPATKFVLLVLGSMAIEGSCIG